jgi:hypothetical protein
MKIKHWIPENLQAELHRWNQLDEKSSRRIVVIAPVKDRDKRRVVMIHPSEGISAVDVDEKRVDEIVREVGSSAMLLVNLAALGVGPLPPPAPPPGPIGDDVIYGAILNAVRTMTTAAELINVRVEQNER